MIVAVQHALTHVSGTGAWAPVISVTAGPYETGGLTNPAAMQNRAKNLRSGGVEPPLDIQPV